MPIQDELPVVIRKARYLPELLPMLHGQDLAAGDNSIITLASPTLSADIPVLTDKFSASPDADALLKLKADGEPTHELETVSLNTYGELTPLEVLASRNVSLVLNADAIVTDYKMYLGIWVVKPSVAQKILWGWALSAEDKALSIKRNIEDSVSKGVLPFPLSYQIQRENMGFKHTYAEIVATAPTGTTTPILTLSAPSRDEFLVLESVTAASVAADIDDNTQLYISRDDDKNYLKLPVFAMDQSYDFPCFIPALRSLEVSFYHEAGADLLNRYVRVIISRYKLTNLLRARFGLETTEEALESVKAGVVP